MQNEVKLKQRTNTAHLDCQFMLTHNSLEKAQQNVGAPGLKYFNHLFLQPTAVLGTFNELW